VDDRFGDGPVTIVFSDVVGSTDLRTARGDDAAHRMLRAHEEVVRRCLPKHQGREVKSLGDGFMLAFTSVRRGLECAIGIQQALAERNVDSPGEEVAVRIGINTGEVTAEGNDLYGQAVNAAARIAAVASGGEILVSEIVRQLAGSGSAFTFVDCGEFGLKGFPEPWRLHALAVEVTRPSVVGQSARTPFVGRQAERVALRNVLAQVQAGTGALVMVGGEPGVGKTRLAEELARRCEREGFLVYTGHCYEAAGAAPYVPIVETYEQALARAPNPMAFRRFLGEQAPEVARLMPRLRALCPDIPASLELPPEQERRYLFNSLWEVLARTARVKPTLLVFDDIHWADEPTMQLIQHIAERVHDVPLLIIGLYRDTELEAGRPLSGVFEELTRRRLAIRIPLKRLPPDTTGEMVKALAGQDPPAALVEAIYRETEGNAFFTEEVYKHLAEEGRLFDADGRFRADLNIDQLEVPEGVRLVVSARLRRLRPDTPQVLAAAAVLGRVFSFELLRQLEQLAEEPLLDLLDEAVRAGVLVAVPGTADDQFMFAHELIRQTVLSQLSAPRRARMHARAAEALEHFHAVDLEPQAATIAHHLIEAGSVADPKRTFRFLLMAGSWALQTAAFEEALTHLALAAERIEAATPTEHAELLHWLGVAQRSAGRWDQVIETWQRAIDACERAGDAELAGLICDEMSYTLAWAGRMEDGIQVAQRGLDLLGDEVNAARVRLLATQGMVAGWADAVPFEAGDALIGQAMDMARAMDDQALVAASLVARSLHRVPWARFSEAAEVAFEAADLLRAIGKPWEESVVLGFTWNSLLGSGRFADAERTLAHVESLAERLGNGAASLQCLWGCGLLDFVKSGDLEALDAFGQRASELAVQLGIPWSHYGRAWTGLAAFLRGDWAQARTDFESAAAGQRPWAWYGLEDAVLLEYHAYTGDAERVVSMLDAPDSLVPRMVGIHQYGRWGMLFSAVESLYVLGEHHRAAELHPMVEAALDAGFVCSPMFDCRLIRRTAGIAASSARRFDDAERHFRIALQQAAELPHLPEQAHTRRFYAAMLRERDAPGDRAEADRLVVEAADLYRRMRMPRHLALAEALM